MTLIISTHKNILIRILKDIYTDSALGPFLGFKGGTAAYLFYGLGRFSVDLDFDLLDVGREDHIFVAIKKILEEYGTLKEGIRKRFNLFFLLSYHDKAEGSQNIKVEVNRREFGSKYEVKSYLGISMKVMVAEDMFAHKLVAMYERVGRANRDIFDVWFFLTNNCRINRQIVAKRTRMPFKDFLYTCAARLEKMDDRRILAGMGELLDVRQKVWVKAKLRTETIFLLKARADSEM